MVALTRRCGVAALLFLAVVPHRAAAQGVAQWRPFISEASLRFGVPIDWIERVMRAESNGRTESNGRPITSPKGAMGLMQLMPATWSMMRARLALGADPYDPHDNIIAGTAYLRLLFDRFGYPGLFAAYNAGPQRYLDTVSGRALPAETRAYVAAITGSRGDAVPRAGEPTSRPGAPSDPLFLIKRDGADAAPPPPQRAPEQPSALFVRTGD